MVDGLDDAPAGQWELIKESCPDTDSIFSPSISGTYCLIALKTTFRWQTDGQNGRVAARNQMQETVVEPDLSLVFAELNLSPHCTLEEFQRTLRRRIGELHPDRAGQAASPEDQAKLHRLLSAYSAVTRFHRRYGRMPGAHLPAGDGVIRATMIHPAFQIPIAPEPEPEPVDVPSSRVALLFIALVLLLASWDWLVVRSS